MNNKVTCKRVRPNPTFEQWLTTMHEDAKKTKSPLEDMLKECLESLIKYPLPLKSGAECIILKGFNKKLCAYLDKLLNDDNNNGSKSCDESKVTASDNSVSKTSSPSIREDLAKSSSNSVASNGCPSVDLIRLPESFSNQDSLEPMLVDMVQESNTATSVSTENASKDKRKGKGKKREKKTVKYKPAHRSGGYALLVALLEHTLESPDKPVLTKEELIEKAQKHAEESLVRPKANCYYNGWSNMSVLQKKGLVKSIKRKKTEYALTEEGKELAKEILEDANNVPTMNDIIFKNLPSSINSPVIQNDDIILDDEIPSSTSSTSVTQSDNIVQMPSTSRNTDMKNIIEFLPETFDIILLIDKNETGGLKKKNDPTVAQFNKYPDLKHEYRSLKVGDFAWIAKHKVHQDQELILPFIVERKRMDDLGASIKDGRFHEQKFRLHKCGIKNVIYLVENYGKNIGVGLPIQNLMQAMANTRVQDGFQVNVTDSLTHSARFLAMLTSRLTIRYKARHLRGCDDDPKGDILMTFQYFNKSSTKSKPLTVTETFIKILLQLKGMSVDKALAITKKYPTPHSLIHAYAKCDRKEGEILLSYLKYGDLNRNVGPATSKAIYQLFSNNGVT